LSGGTINGSVTIKNNLTVASDIYLDSPHKIRFDSSANRGSDYGEIVYEHDYNTYAYWGDNTEENS